MVVIEVMRGVIHYTLLGNYYGMMNKIKPIGKDR